PSPPHAPGTRSFVGYYQFTGSGLASPAVEAKQTIQSGLPTAAQGAGIQLCLGIPLKTDLNINSFYLSNVQLIIIVLHVFPL
ncbi:MAG: hypothetical protein ACTH8J_17025, partial [Specibacter sp.]